MATLPGDGFSEPRVGATPRDEELASKVLSTIKGNTQLQRHPLHVVVCEEDVELRGSVPDAQLRQLAAQLAMAAPGVKNVINHITIGGERA